MQRAGGADGVALGGRLDALLHRRQGREVEHEVRALRRRRAPRPASATSPRTSSTPVEVGEVAGLARGQVVEHADPPAGLDQALDEVRADESRAAGDEDEGGHDGGFLTQELRG